MPKNIVSEIYIVNMPRNERKFSTDQEKKFFYLRIFLVTLFEGQTSPSLTLFFSVLLVWSASSESNTAVDRVCTGYSIQNTVLFRVSGHRAALRQIYSFVTEMTSCYRDDNTVTEMTQHTYKIFKYRSFIR